MFDQDLSYDYLWNSIEYPFWMDTTIPPPSMVYEPVEMPIQLSETYIDGKRWYMHEGEKYPSITTLLSATDHEGKQALARWRARVGREEATRITVSSSGNGTRWHSFCEEYLTGQDYLQSIQTNPDKAMAGAIARLLNARIAKVIQSETRVVSTKYKVAGRMDICVELTDGRLAIVDFKTGRKPKTGNRMANYGIQTTFYAEALTEWLGRGNIDTIVIVQLCPKVLIWQESTKDRWIPLLKERVEQFHTLLD